jgi:hypothetical protein
MTTFDRTRLDDVLHVIDQHSDVLFTSNVDHMTDTTEEYGSLDAIEGRPAGTTA